MNGGRIQPRKLENGDKVHLSRGIVDKICIRCVNQVSQTASRIRVFGFFHLNPVALSKCFVPIMKDSSIANLNVNDADDFEENLLLFLLLLTAAISGNQCRRAIALISARFPQCDFIIMIAP